MNKVKTVVCTITYVYVQLGSDLNATDSSGGSPLHYSVLRGHQHAVLLLLHAGADINIQDSEGNSPLHTACMNGHENCVKGLIYYSENSIFKIDIDRTNRSGNTALHIACRWGYLPIVSVLLEFGSSVKVKNKLGQTPWDVAHSVYVKKELERVQAMQHEKLKEGDDKLVNLERAGKGIGFYCILCVVFTIV